MDPDTLANLGPLRRLARAAQLSRTYRDAADRLAGQRATAFYGLRYYVQIVASDEDSTFHDPVGYWLWEPAKGLIIQTVAFPRGQEAHGF